MAPQVEDELPWGSRKMHLMVVLCQTIGIPTMVQMPHKALEGGGVGFTLGFSLAYMLVGIPLLYMEFIVSQFTSRDCLRVWNIIPCLSHLGYVHIVWQVFALYCNHTIASFLLHYLMISFEEPIPFYRCGPWATDDCNMLKSNYTAIQDCLKMSNVMASDYCSKLYTTFPEYQYWRFFIMGKQKGSYYIAWQICLASAFITIIMFLSAFKGKKSVKWFVIIFSIYPVVGYILLTFGSMTQKGLVELYEDSLDVDFKVFLKRYRVSAIIMSVVTSLNVGTGISFNLSSNSAFRSPCYSNIVITVVVCAVLTAFGVCVTAMMPCPHAYEYNQTPYEVIYMPLSDMFEMAPMMLEEYSHRTIWLIVTYSSNMVLSLSSNIIVFLSLFEMLWDRYPLAAKYPGLVCFFGSLILYLTVTPLLGASIPTILYRVKAFLQFITILLALVECLVFVVWYGLERFAEDVHFMQGIRPRGYMKLAWLTAGLILLYVFVNELRFMHEHWYWGDEEYVGWWLLFFVLAMVFVSTIVRLAVAGCKRRFREETRLEPTWGPRSGLLLRSRAMFTAQAMTKEYMYRQYHLQAGILARQASSNVRQSSSNVRRHTKSQK